jgi:hypothetical protein
MWSTQLSNGYRGLFLVALSLTLISGAAGAGAPSGSAGGSPLIGKLEGPEVITDAAQFPQTFKEARVI